MSKISITNQIMSKYKVIGFHYSEKTGKNIKLLLEAYAYAKNDTSIISASIDTNYRNNAKFLFELMIDKNTMSMTQANSFVYNAFSLGYMTKYANEALAYVKSFVPNGDKYYNILFNLYFNEKPLQSKDILSGLSIVRSTYQLWKKEATMLFGLYFWKQIFDNWDTAIEDMKEIANKLNRTDIF